MWVCKAVVKRQENTKQVLKTGCLVVNKINILRQNVHCKSNVVCYITVNGAIGSQTTVHNK